ncbi:hypothetical protein QLR68_31710 [Micromonospora sp. DH15]|nr:hypothetical protein [Micromonospora sp. DH15]
MGALRKAGVWLGLVEEDDERAYDDGGYEKGGYRESSRYRQGRYAEEFADDDDDDADEPPAPRPRAGERGRLTERSATRPLDSDRDRADSDRPERAERVERPDRSSVRSITRSSGGEGSGALTYHTRDNLALAPQAQPRERVAPVEEEQRYQITTLHPTTYREADQLLSEARSKAEEVTREARAKADALERDARQRHQEAMGGLDAKRTALQKHIEELKQFEREYRTRLKAYLESQLRDLDGRGQGLEAEMTRAEGGRAVGGSNGLAAAGLAGSYGGGRSGALESGR